MRFKEFLTLTEMNVPGYHLDGKGGFAHPSTLGAGALVPSDEKPFGISGFQNVLPSLDLIGRKIPQVLDKINPDYQESDDPDIPICPGMEHLAKVLPTSAFWGTISHVNGVPLSTQIIDPELPKNNIEISFLDEKTGRSITLKTTKSQYHKLKDINDGKDIELGMRVGVLLQRLLNDFRQELPWGKKQGQTTPNNSPIIGIKYYKT